MPGMFASAVETMSNLMHRGGWVMWPLAACSFVAVTVMFERAWFWAATNSPWKLRTYHLLGRYLRQGNRELAMAAIEGDDGVYARLVRQLVQEGATDAAVVHAIESQRPRLERFMPTLSTLITAAPMLGIVGTVTGIIRAFKVLGDATVTDPSLVAAGIAEALLATVTGLGVALIVLFPYNAFRVQVDRTLSRMETLATAVQESGGRG